MNTERKKEGGTGEVLKRGGVKGEQTEESALLLLALIVSFQPFHPGHVSRTVVTHKANEDGGARSSVEMGGGGHGGGEERARSSEGGQHTVN